MPSSERKSDENHENYRSLWPFPCFWLWYYFNLRYLEQRKGHFKCGSGELLSKQDNLELNSFGWAEYSVGSPEEYAQCSTLHSWETILRLRNDYSVWDSNDVRVDSDPILMFSSASKTLQGRRGTPNFERQQYYFQSGCYLKVSHGYLQRSRNRNIQWS